MPKSETTVMLATVVATLITHNLAIGVITGVVTATVLFARRVAHLATMDRTLEFDPITGAEAVRYTIHGEMFFASSNDLVYQFEYPNDPDFVIVDLSSAHVWDASTVATLDAVVTKYERRNKTVKIIGLNEKSAEFHDRLSGKLGSLD
jgi:SulP family sulfate permease